MSIRRTALETLPEIPEKGARGNLTLIEGLRGLEEREATRLSAAVYTTFDRLLYVHLVVAAYAEYSIKRQIGGIRKPYIEGSAARTGGAVRKMGE